MIATVNRSAHSPILWSLALAATLLGCQESKQPRASAASRPPSPDRGQQGLWLRPGDGRAYRVLSTRTRTEPKRKLISVFFEARDALFTTWMPGANDFGLFHEGQEVAFATTSRHGPGDMSEEACACEALTAQVSGDGFTTFATLDAAPGELYWGAPIYGQPATFAIRLAPVEVSGSEAAGSTPRGLEDRRRAQEFWLPQQAWQPEAAHLRAPPAFSVLARAAQGCDWYKQTAQQANTLLAHFDDCDVALAFSGDGHQALATLAGQRRILLRHESGKLQDLPWPPDASAALAMFDSAGRPMALTAVGAERARVSYRDKEGWTRLRTVPNPPSDASRTQLERRTLDDLRPFHCRLLHGPAKPGLPMPLTQGECARPDPETFYDPSLGRGGEPLAAIVAAGVGICGSLDPNAPEAPPLLRAPLRLCAPALGASRPLRGFTPGEPRVGAHVAIRGPYALVTADASKTQQAQHVIYDLESGELIARAPDEALSVALWPFPAPEDAPSIRAVNRPALQQPAGRAAQPAPASTSRRARKAR